MKTTKKQFELFTNECKYWLDRFGLKGWCVEYTNKKNVDNTKANISWRVIGRVANINLEPDWGKEYKAIENKTICESAFHEVCELLLSRLCMMADGKMSNQKDATEEEAHVIIRTLENTLFSDSYRERNN
jgi:hypothetical protein